MAKNVFVLLIGDADGNAVDLYQRLQEEDALAGGRTAGYAVDVAWATSFDQYGVVRKRLAASPVDAVVAEPASVATAGLILKHLKGKTGLVLLNVWDPSFETDLAAWGSGLPTGTISQPQLRIGEIQGRQVSAAMPEGANVLVVTGPPRSSAARERLEGLRSDRPPRHHAPHDRGGPVVGDRRHPRLQQLVRGLQEPAGGDPRHRRAERRPRGRGLEGRQRGRPTPSTRGCSAGRGSSESAPVRVTGRRGWTTAGSRRASRSDPTRAWRSRCSDASGATGQAPPLAVDERSYRLPSPGAPGERAPDGRSRPTRRPFAGTRRSSGRPCGPRPWPG